MRNETPQNHFRHPPRDTALTTTAFIRRGRGTLGRPCPFPPRQVPDSRSSRLLRAREAFVVGHGLLVQAIHQRPEAKCMRIRRQTPDPGPHGRLDLEASVQTPSWKSGYGIRRKTWSEQISRISGGDGRGAYNRHGSHSHPRHRVWRGNLYNRSSMAGEEPIPKYGDNPRAATGNHAGPAASLRSWLQNGLPAWRAGRGRKLQPRSGTDSGYSESLRREVRRAIRSLRARPRV